MKKITLIILLFVLSFSNVCLSQRIKWTESFDDREPVSRGWSFLNNDKGGTEIELFSRIEFFDVGNLEPISPSYFVKFGFESVNRFNQIDDWIITPKLYNIQKGDSLSFWCGAIDRTFKDSLRILISTTDNEPGSFTMIDHFKVDGPVGSWHKKSYDLSAYTGKDIYFAVNYNLKDAGAFGGSSDNVWIDQFTLSGTGFGGILPTAYKLNQNFPNPFNPSTEITFELPQSSKVDIKVYNSLGKEVSRLVDNTEYPEGIYSIKFSGADLSSGIYYYILKAGTFTDQKKMVLVK